MELEDIYRPPQVDLEHQVLVQAQPLPPFFQTSPSKIALLSIATFGIYQLYWFHKQWSRRRTHGEDVIPLLRAIFAVLFMYFLCQSVNREVERRAGPGPSFSGLAQGPLNAGGLALGFLGLNFLWRFSDLLSFVGLLSFLPLVIVQRRINQLHEEVGYDPSEGSSYTLGTVAALLVGGVLWFFVVASFITPPA